jgi:hypothetical protein
METLIEQDFEFNKYSLIYGQFLTEVYESCPDVKVEDVSAHHPYKDRNTHFVSVSVAERLAVVLKLRFGAHLRVRPPPKPKKDPNDGELEYNRYKKASIYDEYLKKRQYERYEEELFRERYNKLILDYPPIIKIQKPRYEDKTDCIDIERLYNEIKTLTNLKSDTEK